MNQSYGTLLKQSIADSTALASSSSQASILKADDVFTLPANFFRNAGLDRIVIRAMGRISTLVTSPGTLSFFVKIGSVNAAASGALSINTTAQTNATWFLEWDLTARVVGASTSTVLMHAGKFTSRATLGNVAVGTAGVLVAPFPDTAPAVGTGFDATAAQTVDLQAQWSVNSASNSILTHSYALFSY